MIANYHTHTWRCNHASDREENYVQVAVEQGMEILGFSDHTPYLFPGSYYSRFRMRPEQLGDYVDMVLKVRRQFAGQIQIHLGLELEYYPGLLPKLLPVLREKPIEYLLLGQHFIGDEIGEHYSGSPTADEEILRRYCHQSMDAMNSGLFTYFAHPDLLHFVGDRKVYERYMAELCREATSCAMPLEMNLLGIREDRNYPNPLFWEQAAEAGCRVILGADAHEPWVLADQKTEQLALEILKTLGIEVMEKVGLKSF